LTSVQFTCKVSHCCLLLAKCNKKISYRKLIASAARQHSWSTV